MEPNGASPDWLDERFPLGDGVADMAVHVTCPYCGADVDIAVDPGGEAVQQYVEDCPVCCRPWQLVVHWDRNGRARAAARTEEDV